MSQEKNAKVENQVVEEMDAELVGDEKPVTADSRLQDDLIKQLTEAQAKVEELTNAVLRAKADAENMRRRAQLDIESAHKYGHEKLIKELLPIVDSIEHSLAISTNGEGLAEKMREGTELTYQLFLSALSKMHVEQVNPLHEDFDSTLHQAVKTEPAAQAKPGSIIQVLQRGYTIHGRLLRPALVVVAA